MATKAKSYEYAEDSNQRPSRRLVFHNNVVEVLKDEISGQNALYASQPFHAGDVICEFSASAILPSPSYLTIQTDTDEHIRLYPYFLQYVNHSCSPNIFFDTTSDKVICLQSVRPGNELTYFYPST